jgi:pimeloyl-ACP methyl ester carboxylesterase
MGERNRRGGWVPVGTAAVVLSSLVAAPAAAELLPVIAWQPCTDPNQSGFECATAEVPLDYRDPHGFIIDLALIRHSATDPDRRIGTLFFNPGGPGGSGTESLPNWLELFPAKLRARFDLVSWDPRGIGGSTAVECFDTPDEALEFFADLPSGFPVGGAETNAWVRGYARFGQICAERNGDLLEHVSTADTARDLDLLRRAMGDQPLNYLGLSYGTFLGATYANLFPDTVRAMVLDGNVDPVAWTNGGNDDTFLSTSLRLRSDIGNDRTLDKFLTLCGDAGTDQCTFSAGNAAATRAKFTILLLRLRAHPIPFNGNPITYATLVHLMTELLVVVQEGIPPFPGWAFTAELLETLWTGGSGGTPPPPEYDFREQRYAVQCLESPNPRRPDVFQKLAALAFARAGDVGRAWVWGDEPCATWQAVAADRYSGPWNRRTAKPILVIGNTFDPQTPHEGAVAMAKELALARLLTVEGYGHSALLNPSTCANNHVSDYFVHGTLPPVGTICRQDQQPFEPAPGSLAGSP